MGDWIKSKIDWMADNTKSKSEEAYDILNDLIIAHVGAENGHFLAKARFLAFMIWRLIDAINDPKKIDDKDYYGNKRLELAGDLVSLLFEDAFRNYVDDLKRIINWEIPKCKRRGDVFDVTNAISWDTITEPIQNAISTGNWKIAWFKVDRQGIT